MTADTVTTLTIGRANDLVTHAAGTLRFVRTNGSPEKSVEAHRGAVLCARWSLDGRVENA